MLILFSYHKLTPRVIVIQNALCDLAALQTQQIISTFYFSK